MVENGHTIQYEIRQLNCIYRQRNKIRALERELARAKSCVLRLRATLNAEQIERRGEIDRLATRASDGWKGMALYKRRWQWVSRIVRRFVSPEQVNRFRNEEDGDGQNRVHNPRGQRARAPRPGRAD